MCAEILIVRIFCFANIYNIYYACKLFVGACCVVSMTDFCKSVSKRSVCGCPVWISLLRFLSIYINMPVFRMSAYRGLSVSSVRRTGSIR